MEQQVENLAGSNQVAALQMKMALEAKVKSGLGWFFWIAGLSIINSIIFLMDGNLTFVVGLGATQFVDGIVSALAADLSAKGGTIVYLIGGFLNLTLAGIFALAGFLGKKKHRWAVITGGILYVLDAVLLSIFGDWLGVAFHALALWGIWRGLQAIILLRKLDQPPVMPSVPVLP